MVIPLRSGRQNHPLGLGECRRHGRGSSGVAARPLAPSPPQPRFGIEPAGQDPGEAVTPGRRHYRSGRSRMPVLSATILDAGADNRLVAGSSPLSAPPRSPALTPSSLSPWNTLDFPALWGRLMVRSRSLRETKTVRKRIVAFRL